VDYVLLIEQKGGNDTGWVE